MHLRSLLAALAVGALAVSILVTSGSAALAPTATAVTAPATDTATNAIAASAVSAVLSGAAASPAAGGTMTFTVFGPAASAPADCSTGGTVVGSPVTVSGNGLYNPNAGFTPPTPGTYWWSAAYSGDTSNGQSESGCGGQMPSTVVGTGSSSPGAPPAQTPPTTAAEETIRSNVANLLSGLRGDVTQMQADPTFAKALASSSEDPLTMIDSAEQQLSSLGPAELDDLQQVLEAIPGWQQLPSTLSNAVTTATASPAATAKASSATSSPSAAKSASPETIGAPAVTHCSLGSCDSSVSGTYTSDCSTAGNEYDEWVSELALNEAQSAAYAAQMAVPSVVAIITGVDAPTVVKQVLAAIWGVADAAYLAVSQLQAVALDCEQTDFSNNQLAALPCAPPAVGPSDCPSTPVAADVVPASSQVSIDALLVAAGNSASDATIAKVDVNNVDTEANSVETAVTNLEATLNVTLPVITAVQSDLQTLKANVDILKNTEVTALTKADTAIVNLSTFQTLQLRMAIEQNLAAHNGVGTAPIGLFELPAVDGGYLEMVRSIVTQTLANEGVQSSKAQSQLTQANNYFTAGQYKNAYAAYSNAYQDAS